MLNKLKKNYDLLPLVIFETYLFITLLLFYFGPLEYEKINTFQTLFFILLYQFVFFVGYMKVRKKFSNHNLTKKNENKTESDSARLLLNISLVFAIIVSYVSLAGFSFTFNPIVIIKDVLAGIANPSLAYAKNTAIEIPFISSRVLNIFLMFASVLSYFAYANGCYRFSESKLSRKILIGVALLTEISTGLIRGTNISIFRMVVIISVITLLVSLRNRDKLIFSKKKMLLIGAIGLSFVIYFVISTSSRMALDEIPDVIFRLPVRKDNLIMQLLPNGLKMPYIMISFYLSQGYYAFSSIFNYTFHTTFGVGNGWFLLNNFASLTSIPLFARTYIAKMRYHWSPTINWHSAYTWFANDFSVFGVVIIMYYLGKYFFSVMKKSYEGDQLSIAILPLLVLMLLFIPANNVVLSAPQTALPFLVFTFVFVLRELFSNNKNESMNSLFLGGVYEPSLEAYYIDKSRGNGIQNAVNNHQWNLIKGICKNTNIEVLSSRYLHSFPNYSQIFIRSKESLVESVYLNNIGYINLPVLKQITKSFYIFTNMFKWALRTDPKYRVVYVYYPSSILMLQSTVIKMLFKNVKLISIIPDLPTNTNLSQKKSSQHTLNEKIFDKLISQIDYFILLTNQMASFFNLSEDKYFVMEGTVTDDDFKDIKLQKYDNRTVLYSGSLNIKYGIKDFIDTLIAENFEHEVHIYGKGEYEEELKSISEKHPNIKYYGYVTRREILEAESRSHIVVNPRKNEEDFNNYSFPSKNIEYLLSGTPFVGYKLSGIPDEYLNLFVLVSEGESIASVLNRVMDNIEEFDNLAQNSRKYILDNKTSDKLCLRMIKHFNLATGVEENE